MPYSAQDTLRKRMRLLLLQRGTPQTRELIRSCLQGLRGWRETQLVNIYFSRGVSYSLLAEAPRPSLFVFGACCYLLPNPLRLTVQLTISELYPGFLLYIY